MKYTLKGDEIHIILEQGDRWTDQTLSPSPTVVSAGTVWAREVLKPLLVDLLPVVEETAEYSPDNVFDKCFYCRAFTRTVTIPVAHYDGCETLIAKAILPRLRKAIGELEKQPNQKETSPHANTTTNQ